MVTINHGLRYHWGLAKLGVIKFFDKVKKIKNYII